MGEYIPVKDFAELIGVTIGAVYKRKKDCSIDEYTREENGIMLIDPDASKLFRPRKSSGVDNTQGDSSGVERPDLMYNVLQSTIQELSAQLQVKDKQLAEANERLNEAQALNHNNLVLLLEKQEKLLEEPEPSAPAPEQPAKNRKIRDRFKAFFQ